MGNGYKTQRQGLDAIAAKFKTMQAEIDALKASAGIRNAVISAGGTITIQDGSLIMKDTDGDVIVKVGLLDGGLHGVEVSDNAGVKQVRLGELAAGGYGLEQIGVDGTTVPLDILAYGIKAESVSAGTFINIADTAGAFVNGSGGPSVSGVVVGPSGRMLVQVGALISPDANFLGTIGYALSGASTVPASGLHGASFFTLGTTVAGASVSSTSLQEGLTPGVYTVTAKYLVNNISGSGNCGFDNRFIVAQPF